MSGVQNFYKQETKTPQDIVFTIEQDAQEENASPKTKVRRLLSFF